MTLQETSLVMDLLSAAYPQFYKARSEEERFTAATLWADLFKDDPVEVVLAAVKRLLASDVKGFPPVIGQVKEQIARLREPVQPTDSEAWALVRKAVADYSYYDAPGKNPFYALPEEIRAVVGSPSTIRQWATELTSDAFETVIKSHFVRAYRAKTESVREFQKLPADIRALSERLAGESRLSIPGKNPAPEAGGPAPGAGE